MSIDNRRRQRHQFNKSILCFKCMSGDPLRKIKVPFLFEIKDVSYGGIGITCQKNLPIGSVLTFRLTEAEGARQFTVVVKWSQYNGESYLMGTQFDGVVKEDIIFLYSLIANL